MANKEEGNSQMALRKHNRAHVKRCKKAKSSSTSIESLPDELLFDILVHLPAQDIYDSAMLVCRKWYNIIHARNFAHENLEHSTDGLLIQSIGQHEHAVFVTMRRGKIEISKFGYEFEDKFWSGCNGLLLQSRYLDGLKYYIANPITKRNFDLSISLINKRSALHRFGIAYAAASMLYKVVETCNYWDCAIFTVGVDKSWRRVSTEHLSFKGRELLKNVPLTTEGFIHWTSIYRKRVLTLNIETEIITEIPFHRRYRAISKYYLVTRKSLTLLVARGGFSWKVWELKPETGIWTKVLIIDLEPQKGKFGNLVRETNSPPLYLMPVGWLNHGDVLVLRGSHTSRVCVLYNVRTQEIDFFKLDYYCHRHLFAFHRNSLVSLDG